MREGLNIREVEGINPDLMGFIFYPRSKRYVGPDFDKSLLPMPGSNIRTVAVFVNSNIDEVQKIIDSYGFDTIQLHGSETPDFCAHFKNKGIKVFKAFGLFTSFNWEILTPYQPVCEYFLFDTNTEGYGGGGEKFDWQMLEKYELEHPFILSGGIHAHDAADILAIKSTWLAGVDINSRFEITPGLKNVKLVKRFIDEIKK